MAAMTEEQIREYVAAVPAGYKDPTVVLISLMLLQLEQTQEINGRLASMESEAGSCIWGNAVSVRGVT